MSGSCTFHQQPNANGQYTQHNNKHHNTIPLGACDKTISTQGVEYLISVSVLDQYQVKMSRQFMINTK